MTALFWYNEWAELQLFTERNSDMELNRKIEISIAGLMLVAVSLSVLAVATDRLVKSITTYERMSGTGDYSIDETEFPAN